WKALENDVYCFDVTISLNGFSDSLSLVTPSSVIEGQTSGPFSTEARIILPCGLFIIYSSILLFHESYKCFSSIGGLLSPLEKSDLSARSRHCGIQDFKKNDRSVGRRRKSLFVFVR
ncbi:hypothetical protein Tco_1118666, partial [Tanacetum coccineum]